MRIAALTYVYNESFNLRIWLKYYGTNFGANNLYIIDRDSSDGSIKDIGQANLIKVPWTKFDDIHKAAALSAMHTALLQSFDCVIVTDCDEIIIPDPLKYENLSQYINENKPVVAYCLGLNVKHVLTKEGPLDLDRPLLSQRKIAHFNRPTSKPLISSVPTTWEPGGHACNLAPYFDKDLFMFHIKSIDYNLSMSRQKINQETEWSQRALDARHGAHHRYNYDRFVQEWFLDVISAVRSGKIENFEFEQEIHDMVKGAKLNNNVYNLGDVRSKWVEIPDRFSGIF